MRLSINSQQAVLGIQTQNAQYNMRNELPKVEIETKAAELNMSVTLPTIEIDQRQCFSESGLKGVLELATENVQNAVQIMYASIGRIAEQGNELTNIQNGGNVIADQAVYNAYEQFATDYNMVTMPRSRPKITVREGKISTNPTAAEFRNKPRLTKPEIDYQAGKVTIYMLRESSLKIRFEPTQFDQKG
jgi:hypothetical protein